MSWHSKRHNIKHKKAAEDAKKAKVYSTVAKIITVAARGGADPSMNPALQQALQKAKYNSLPKEVVDKAIKKWSWLGQDAADFQEIIYEWYWPGGVAFLIKTSTDNTNRTSGTVRLLLQKAGWSIAKPGAVARQFAQKGVIEVDGMVQKTIDKGRKIETTVWYDSEELELAAMELDVEEIDYLEEEHKTEIITSKEAFLDVCAWLEQDNYHICKAELEYLADNTITVDDEILGKCEKLVEVLEEDDDVDAVYINIEG